MVQRPDEVASLGRMLHASRGRGMVLCTPMGMRIGVAPRLLRRQDYHSVILRTLGRRAPCVMALAQEEGQPLLLPVLTAFQREFHSRGGAMHWRTEVLRPRRMPGMATPDAHPLARHCVRLSGAGGQEAAAELASRLKALEGADGCGTLISSWLPDEQRGAVLAPVVHGAIPLVVESLRRLLAAVSLKVLMIGRTLANRGSGPSGHRCCHGLWWRQPLVAAGDAAGADACGTMPRPAWA